MQPDWVWIKSRNGSGRNHCLYDVVRGVNKRLESDGGGAENTDSGQLTSFDSDGYTVGTTEADINSGGRTFASWNWKAGGSASNNTDGNTTTSVSVNQTAGFSIMKYDGDGNESTIGHGLNAEPEYIIFKEIDGGESWRVWSKYTPDTASKALALNLSDGAFSQTTWIGTISSSIITIGSDSSINTSGNSYICYAFAPKKGFSSAGSYVGNGNADGTFIYLGFKPAWFMCKESSNGGNWIMFDNKREPFNLNNDFLQADLSDAEVTGNSTIRCDFVSNGVKLRGTNNAINRSGGTYIYMCFAESSFTNSNGVPNNAR